MIKFNYISKVQLRNAKFLKHFLQELAKTEGRVIERVDYIFCTDEYLLSMNQQFLEHDTYTDIITFDLSETKLIEGEIYISIDRVRDNAKVHGESFSRELRRVMFHGVLHLVGYKDKTKSESRIMREKEEFYLRLFDKRIDERI